MAVKRSRRRILLTCLLAAIGAPAVGILAVKALGYRITLSGSGLYPVFERPESEAHYTAIEADRAQNAAAPSARRGAGTGTAPGRRRTGPSSE